MPDYAGRERENRFILPFATPAEHRVKDFSKNMEMAAILYLAESGREKAESHILKRPDEKIVFVTKVYYPIWLIPYNGATLVFDGLGISSFTLPFEEAPDTHIFNRDIQEGQKTTQGYLAALARNRDFFGDFSGKEEQTIEGLVAIPDLLEDLGTYIQQMKEITKPLETRAILLTAAGQREIQTSIQQLSDLRRRTDKDIEALDTSIRLLNATTTEKVTTIRAIIKKAREEYDKQIEKMKPIVARRILEIQERYDQKIMRVSKEFKDELRQLHKRQFRLQETFRSLRAQAKKCEARIESGKRKKKKQTQSQWRLKQKRIRKQLPAVNKEIKGTRKKIHEIENCQEHELAQMEVECDAYIEGARKPLRNLEASREATIMMRRQEIVTMEDMTSQITGQMREAVEAKRMSFAEFDKLGIPNRSEIRALVYVPFYLVRYEREDKKRYVVYPPSLATNLGAFTRMKGTIGAIKMKSLLQPRSKAITAFLSQLVERMTKSAMLEKEVTEACIQDSILLSKEHRIGTKEGLEELEKENWMSQDELETFCNLLYVYA